MSKSKSSSSNNTEQALQEVQAQQLRNLCNKFLQVRTHNNSRMYRLNSCETESESSSNPPLSSSSTPTPASIALDELRKYILLQPMPHLPKTATTCSIRGDVWQLLLGVGNLSSAFYASLISLGPCQPNQLYTKIRGDCFRTFQDDKEFWEVVKEEQMSRVLNAFVQQQSKTKYPTKQGTEKPSPFTYLQGMNAISGCFLFCMSELDSFYAFSKFITEKTPLYWVSSHIGANAGCKLVDAVLAVVDPKLAAHLKETTPGAYVYAFHCVSGFCSTIRPLAEVLKLWDFLLAFGPHFNVLCVAAQIVLVRNALLASSNPKSILDYRVWPALQAGITITLAMSFLPKLSPQLYEQIVHHATDTAVAELISETHMHDSTKDIDFSQKVVKG